MSRLRQVASGIVGMLFGGLLLAGVGAITHHEPHGTSTFVLRRRSHAANLYYTGGSITATKEKRMTRIIVDSDLLTKLLNLSQPREFCTKSGFVLGTFTPLPERESVLRAEPYVSEEELDQRAQGPGFSTDEVITYLESL